MNHTKKVLEDNLEEFDKKFVELRFGDGSVLGNGKSAYLSLKENIEITEIRKHLSSSQTKLIEKIIEDLDNIEIETVGNSAKTVEQIQSNLKELLVGVK
jgi:hypothetical protein